MKRLLIIFLVLYAPAWATTTVTGNMKNLGGSNVTGGFMRFWLRGCAGNQPRVSGAGLIAPTLGGVFYFDLPANASGAVSGTLYSNRDATGVLAGDIECGGSLTSTWYGMQAFFGGKGGPEVAVYAKNGATLDISNVTPITTNPVVTPPSGDSTYLRLNGGNSPITGPVSFSGGSLVSPPISSPTSTGTDNGTETLVNKSLTSPTSSGTDNGVETLANKLFTAVTSTALNPAQSGWLKMGTSDTACWRNFANLGDVCLSKDNFDKLVFPTPIVVPAVTITVPNDTVTGTSNNKFATCNGLNPCGAILQNGTHLFDSGTIGIVVSGGGTSGSASIAIAGLVSCTFATGTTANHWVILDVTGGCLDSGVSSATNPYFQDSVTVGIVQSTNAGGGTYQILLVLPHKGEVDQRFGASCSTAASVGAVCTTTYNWTAPLQTLIPVISCIGEVGTGVPVITGLTATNATSFTIQIAALTAVAANYTHMDCFTLSP